MSQTRETTFSFFVKYVSPLMFEVYLLLTTFFQSYILPLSSVNCFIFGRDGEEDR